MLQKPWPDLLCNLPLFRELTDPEKEALVQDGKPHVLRRKQCLFQHGDPVSAFYVIINGTIRESRARPGGDEKTSGIFVPGDTLGEREIFEDCRIHRSGAEAVEEATVVEFPASWLKEAVKKSPQFSLNLLSQISKHASMATLEVEHQAQGSAVMLVACFLQRMCVAYGFDPEGFDLPYGKALIASRLGMKFETFSRALAKLRSNGIVVNGRHVRIENHARLERYVCTDCSIADSCPTRAALRRK